MSWTPNPNFGAGAVSGAGIFGPYADTTALQAAKPAASNPGSLAYVGASAPFTEYVSSGVSWATVGGGGGSGTVTSVAATVPAFLSLTGSPITTAGTLAIAYSGAALPIANGGTGTATPGIVAGANVSVTGAWPNQTVAATGAVPAGSTTQVQFNDSGAFAGATGLTWDKTTNILSIAAGTHTTSQPQTVTETWNNVSTTFTAYSLNVTDTASSGSSLLATWQVGGTYKFKIDKSGNIQCVGSVTASGNLLANGVVQVSGGMNLTSDTNPLQFGAAVDVILGRAAAAALRLGAINAASPISQTLTTQGPRGGIDSNVAGATLKISAGPSTGIATPNSIALQSTVVAASGTAAQTQLDTFTVQNGSTRRRTVTVATLPASPTAGDECNVSDAMAPIFLGALTGGGAVYCGARYNGAAWVAF